jgi:hypothetical protein
MAEEGVLVRTILEGNRLKKMIAACDAQPLSQPCSHLLTYGHTGGNEVVQTCLLDSLHRNAQASYAKAQSHIRGLERRLAAEQRRRQRANLGAILSCHQPAIRLADSQKLRVKRFGDPARGVAEEREREKEIKRLARQQLEEEEEEAAEAAAAE